MIREKREARKKDHDKYEALKKEVQKCLRADKKKQLDGICEQVEEANNKGDTKRLYQTVKI